MIVLLGLRAVQATLSSKSAFFYFQKHQLIFYLSSPHRENDFVASTKRFVKPRSKPELLW